MNQGGPVLIREQTDPDIQNLEFALEGPAEIPEELVEAYRLRNNQPYTLERNFTLEQDYTLMPQSEYDDLLRTGTAKWVDFRTKYPEVDGSLPRFTCRSERSSTMKPLSASAITAATCA